MMRERKVLGLRTHACSPYQTSYQRAKTSIEFVRFLSTWPLTPTLFYAFSVEFSDSTLLVP